MLAYACMSKNLSLQRLKWVMFTCCSATHPYTAVRRDCCCCCCAHDDCSAGYSICIPLHAACFDDDMSCVLAVGHAVEQLEEHKEAVEQLEEHKEYCRHAHAKVTQPADLYF